MKRALLLCVLLAGCGGQAPVAVPVVTPPAVQANQEDEQIRRELSAASEAIQRDDFATAMQRIDTAQGIKHTPQGFLVRAGAYGAQGDGIAAVKECERGLEEFPGDAALTGFAEKMLASVNEQNNLKQQMVDKLRELRERQAATEDAKMKELQRGMDKRAEEDRRWKEMERERKRKAGIE